MGGGRGLLTGRRSVAVFESPAGVAGLDDVAMVGQSIEHGGGHLGVAEDLRPIGEGKIRRDEQRRVLVELADQVEQQLSAGLAERQIAEFVDDDEIVTQQLLRQAPAAAEYGRGAPKISKPDWTRAEKSGLIPDMSQYADWVP